MSAERDLESLINSELRKLRARLTDLGNPFETAILTMCLGEFSQELFTRLTASGNTTIDHGKAFFSKLAATVGTHPRVPANDVGPQFRRQLIEANHS